MTEKRYYVHKHHLKSDKVHDKICHRFMDIDETVDHMNICYKKYGALKKENEQLKKENKELRELLNIGKTNAKEIIDVLNEQEQYKIKANELEKENEHYKSIFFEIVETALTDKNCRELYCEGILDIFDKANSLNQAREMIKEFME